MFDFSWGKVLFTVSAGAYLIGKKNLPQVARLVGGYMGRGVGSVLRFKHEVWDATRNEELVQLHREFQAGLKELDTIRHELAQASTLDNKSAATAINTSRVVETRTPPSTERSTSTANATNLRQLMKAEAVFATDEKLKYKSKAENIRGDMVDLVNECLVQHTLSDPPEVPVKDKKK